jgi:aryl carrier-like protein
VSRTVEPKTFEPPVGDTEEALAAAWEKILKTRPIGRDDNFFALGGDSLSLIRLLLLLRRQQFEIELEDLIKNQTVAALAVVLGSGRVEGANPG